MGIPQVTTLDTFVRQRGEKAVPRMMKPLKLFGMVIFCGLLSPTQGVLSGLSCAVSPRATQQALSDAIIQNGLLQKHLQGLVLPNIMSDGGLLNSPTIITGLHLERSRMPTLSMELLPGIGMQLVITVRLDLSGNCLLGLLSEVIVISADVTVTTNIKCSSFESGAVQVIADDCFCILGAVKIKLLSGLLSLSVHDIVLSHLTATLPGLLCPVIDIVFNIVNIQLLSTLDVVIPVGSKGTVHYHLAGPPFTSGSSLIMDLDGTVQQMGGSIIPHDSYASALPPLLDRLLIIGVRQSFLNSLLALLLQIQPHTFPCSSEAFSGANQLRDSITALYPTGCNSCPGASPLSIRVESVGNPILLLEPNKATVELSVLLQVFVKRPDGSIINLLLLKADLSLNVRLSISRGSLVLAFSLGRVSLILQSSDIGISDISNLKPHLIKLLVETYLPLLNAAAAVGIPLPDVFRIPLIRVDFQISLGLLLILV
ncbi:BPI fold-containing family B member 4-like isoform X1 [Lagopus leucura]|uniref:BPI fold-containing family B member 4-like isoform X1 n=1 Tax=Lagopus leucura TaxID=30410 RepID=UPI001C67C411|nr:BPI fold-containing family B member 4-like isoform X1 [Lagopus leucura]